MENASAGAIAEHTVTAEYADRDFTILAAGKSQFLVVILSLAMLAGAAVMMGTAGPGRFIFLAIMFSLVTSMLMDWRHPLRIESDGRMIRFSNEQVMWRTERENIKAFQIIGNRLCFTFGDQEVAVERGKMAESSHAKKHHYDFSIMIHALQPEGILRVADSLSCDTSLLRQQCETSTLFAEKLSQITPFPYVTTLIVILNAAIFCVMTGTQGINSASMVEWGANFEPRIAIGQWWRLLTAVFLHFSVLHVAFNCFVLWGVGGLTERLLGRVRYLFIYLFTGTVGSITSMLYHPEGMISAGASGAVFGIVGTLLGIIVSRPKMLPQAELAKHRGEIMTFVVFNLIFGLSTPQIDMAAHIGGFLAGIVGGLLLSRDLFNNEAAMTWIRLLSFATVAVISLGYITSHYLMLDPRLVKLATRMDNITLGIQETILDSDGMSGVVLAEVIRREGEKGMEEIASELDAMGSLSAKSEASRQQFDRLANLYKDVYLHLANYHEYGDFVQYGMCVEKSEEAIALLPNFTAPAKLFHDELALGLLADYRADRQVEVAWESLSEGNLSATEFSQEIESSVFVPLKAAIDRFVKNAESTDGFDAELSEHWRNYLSLRLESHQVWSQGTIGNDSKLIEQARELGEKAIKERNFVLLDAELETEKQENVPND